MNSVCSHRLGVERLHVLRVNAESYRSFNSSYATVLTSDVKCAHVALALYSVSVTGSFDRLFIVIVLNRAACVAAPHEKVWLPGVTHVVSHSISVHR